MFLRISIASAVLVLAGCAGPRGHDHPGQGGPKGMMKEMAMKDKSMSFFITSVNPGKGADLGGLAGADVHCSALAQTTGVKGKNWKAYLSSTKENARDRIGKGPWMNAKGVVVATSVADLHSDNNKLTKENLLDEKGMVVNGREDKPNRHDVMTASNANGMLEGGTCNDWTTSGEGSILVGHHDRVGGGAAPTSWNAAHPSKGCGMEALKSTGGDGLFYCFAAN